MFLIGTVGIYNKFRVYFIHFFIRNPDVNHKKKNDNVSFCKQTETLQKLKKNFQS